MKTTATKKLAVRIDTPNDLGAEIRQIAASIPGLKVGTITIMAVRAGLPLVKRRLVEKAAKLSDD